MIIGSIIKNIGFIWAGLWVALAGFVLTYLASVYYKKEKSDKKETEETKKKQKLIIGCIVHSILIITCSVIIRFGLI